MATRRELKQLVGERYRAAGRWERRQILDEFTPVTDYHCKHALRVLHRPFVPRTPRKRRRIYDEAVRQRLTRRASSRTRLNRFSIRDHRRIFPKEHTKRPRRRMSVGFGEA
jgi:hypothetical protein